MLVSIAMQAVRMPCLVAHFRPQRSLFQCQPIVGITIQCLQDCSCTRLLDGIRPETIISGSFSAVQQICRDSVPWGQYYHLTCLRGLGGGTSISNSRKRLKLEMMQTAQCICKAACRMRIAQAYAHRHHTRFLSCACSCFAQSGLQCVAFCMIIRSPCLALLQVSWCPFCAESLF